MRIVWIVYEFDKLISICWNTRNTMVVRLRRRKLGGFTLPEGGAQRMTNSPVKHVLLWIYRLVVWNIFFNEFPFSWEYIIIPTDELIFFFRGIGIPPTREWYSHLICFLPFDLTMVNDHPKKSVAPGTARDSSQFREDSAGWTGDSDLKGVGGG